MRLLFCVILLLFVITLIERVCARFPEVLDVETDRARIVRRDNRLGVKPTRSACEATRWVKLGRQ